MKHPTSEQDASAYAEWRRLHEINTAAAHRFWLRNARAIDCATRRRLEAETQANDETEAERGPHHAKLAELRRSNPYAAARYQLAHARDLRDEAADDELPPAA